MFINGFLFIITEANGERIHISLSIRHDHIEPERIRQVANLLRVLPEFPCGIVGGNLDAGRRRLLRLKLLQPFLEASQAIAQMRHLGQPSLALLPDSAAKSLATTHRHITRRRIRCEPRCFYVGRDRLRCADLSAESLLRRLALCHDGISTTLHSVRLARNFADVPFRPQLPGGRSVHVRPSKRRRGFRSKTSKIRGRCRRWPCGTYGK